MDFVTLTLNQFSSLSLLDFVSLPLQSNGSSSANVGSLGGAITGIDYSKLATMYGNMKDSLNEASVYLSNALSYVVNLNSIYPTKDLIFLFSNAYNNQYTNYQSGYQFFSVIRALNNHILNRATTLQGKEYTSIQDWFDDQIMVDSSISFPQSWADMSKMTGVDIDNYVS